MKPTVAVIGGGSWATAIVKIISTNVDAINWWVRSQDTVDFIHKYKHNPNYLSDVEIDLGIVEVTHDLKKAIKESQIIVLAVPSAFLKTSLEKITDADFKNKLPEKYKESFGPIVPGILQSVQRSKQVSGEKEQANYLQGKLTEQK